MYYSEQKSQYCEPGFSLGRRYIQIWIGGGEKGTWMIDLNWRFDVNSWFLKYKCICVSMSMCVCIDKVVGIGVDSIDI